MALLQRFGSGVLFTVVAAVSMSSGVVQRPRDSRTAARARSVGWPMAVRTGEGVWAPLWHADPVEAARVAASSSRACPRVPSMLMLRVLGSRAEVGPLRW